MIYVDQETQARVNQLFGFVADGSEQDWPLEFADANRIDEFLIAAKWNGMPFLERYGIVELILYSYDEFLDEKCDANQRIWTEVVALLDLDPDTYGDLLNYWAQWEGTEDEHIFHISRLVRGYITDRRQEQTVGGE